MNLDSQTKSDDSIVVAKNDFISKTIADVVVEGGENMDILLILQVDTRECQMEAEVFEENQVISFAKGTLEAKDM